MFDDLFGVTQQTVSPNIDITVVPNNPSYVGQSLKVRISTYPTRKVAYIKVTAKNFVNGEEKILPVSKNVSSAEYIINVESSEFAFYVEIPGKVKEYGKEVWWPSKNNPLKVKDSSPPQVSLNVFRLSETSNQYDISLDVDETKSKIVQKWITIDDQPMELSESRMIRELSIGEHVIRGYAKNEFNVTGSSFNNYLEVSPPKGDSYISFRWETPTTIYAYSEERVNIIAEIYDHTSYLKKIEILLPSGGRRKYNFDPLIPSYNLNYSFTALESGAINVIATNGNGKTQTEKINLVVNAHKAPRVVLTPNINAEVNENTVYPFNVFAESQSDSKIEKLYLVIDGATVKALTDVYDMSVETDYQWTVPRGKHSVYAVAVDEKGAKGYSDTVEITGLVDDKDPPVIQLFVPSVAYTGIETNISCSVRDNDSELAGSPEIKVVEEDKFLVPQTFDNSFFFAKWKPASEGEKKILVTARDKVGNFDVKEAVVTVKDPTGIVLPTILDLSATPNPVYIGSSVKLAITVIPPSQVNNVTPIVEFQIVPPNGTGISASSSKTSSNVYSATYNPENSGIHTIIANIQWGDYSYTETGSFEVLSPDPGSDFTVEPTATYIGDTVTLWLNPYSDNPNASITVQSMTFDSKPLTPFKMVNSSSGRIMYYATSSTIDSSVGNKIATARYMDNFNNFVDKEASVYLRMPVLSILGVNIDSQVGSEYQAYTPVNFEVVLDKTYPDTLIPTGRIQITSDSSNSSMRSQETIQLTKHATDNYLLVSDREWLPPAEGVYLVEAFANIRVGSEILEDDEANSIIVNPAAIDITLNSTPVSIERITVGRTVDLDFLVTGIPPSDLVNSFQYAIYKGSDVYVKSRTLQESAPGLYQDSLDPFLLSDNYRLVATVTTIAPSVKAKHWDFFVLPSEIRKKTFKLDGNANNIVFGKDMYFDLELENPNIIQNLSIKMFLVDENKEKLADVDPITADPVDSEFKIFRNRTPFRMYSSTRFTVAASVTIEEVPQIDLPTMYGDSEYFMPEPNVNIFFDKTNKYYDGYLSSLNITVTKPSNMNIQIPKVRVLDNAGNINPIPYSTDVSASSTHYYDFYITPERLGDIVVEVNVYESDDLNYQNPVANATTTLNVEEFLPTLRISGGEGVDEFVQAKNPTVLVEISEIPEFFDGQYTFITRLDGNKSKVFPVVTGESSALILFDYNYLFNKLGINAVTVSAEVQAMGNESFTINASKMFDVRLPSLSNSRFPAEVINKTYHAFSESTMLVDFNNNDKVTENIDAYLYVYDPVRVSTDTYNGVVSLPEDSVNAQAAFHNVVFPEGGQYDISAKLFCSNSSPEAFLDQTSVEKVSVENIGTFVDIKYPYNGEEIFVGDSLRPKAVLTNIPNVLSVRFAIFDSDGATVVSNGRSVLNQNGEWEMLEIDSKPLNKTGTYRVKVIVASESVDEMTKENEFEVVVGHFRSVSLKRDSGGYLIQTGEAISFTSDFTFDNPNKDPSVELSAINNLGIKYSMEQTGSEIKDNGELRQFINTWQGNTSTTPLDPGDYVIEFKSILMDTTIEASINITVVSKITMGSVPTVSPSEVPVGGLMSAEVHFTVPQNIVDYCGIDGLSDYITGNIIFENCDNQTLEIEKNVISATDGVDFVIRRQALASSFGGESGDKDTFDVIFNASIDGDNVLNERLQFTITEP